MTYALLLFILMSPPTGNDWTASTQPELERVWVKGVILQAEIYLKDPGHPFNNTGNVATVEFMVRPDGSVAKLTLVGSNGVGVFDTTVLEACRDVRRFAPPPISLLSDDGMVHLFWTLSRAKPYLRNPTVRFVRFPPSKAIPMFFAKGSALKAVERTFDVGRKAVAVFVDQLKSRYGARVMRYKTLLDQGMDAYLRLGGDPVLLGSLLMDRLMSYKPEELHDFLAEHPSTGLMCSLLALPIDAERRIAVERALLEGTSGVPPCPGRAYWENRSKKNDFKDHYTAVAALFRISQDEATRALILKAFKDPKFKRYAIRAMGLTRSKKFESRLISLFVGPHKGSIAMRAEALKSLYLVGTKRAKVLIVAHAQKKNATLRTVALRLAVNMDGMEKARGYAFIAAVRKDPSYENKLTAAEGLARVAFPTFKPEVLGLLKNVNPDAVAATLKGLDPTNPDGKKMILKFLTDKRLKVRRTAAVKLLKVASDPVVAQALANVQGDDQVLAWIRTMMGNATTEGLFADNGGQVLVTAYALYSKGNKKVLMDVARKWLSEGKDGMTRLLLMILGVGLK